MNKLLMSILLLSIMSCEQKKDSLNFTNNETSNVGPQKICALSENIKPISSISTFSFLSDSSILLSSNSDLFVYSNSGTQQFIWNRIGKASNEYVDAKQFFISENYIYVFDAAQLRIVVYDRDYQYIKNFNPTKNAISKFVVYNDRYICLFNAGGVSYATISIYDIDTGTTTDIGVNSEEDLLLLIRDGVGAMTIVGDRLLFLHPSTLTLYVYDFVENKLINTVMLNDPDFSVNQIEGTAAQMMSNDRNNVFKFIMDNSTVLDIESVDQSVYVLAEVGKKSSEKHIKIYQLTQELQPVKTTRHPYYPMMAPMLTNGKIHFVQYDKDNLENGLIMYKFN